MCLTLTGEERERVEKKHQTKDSPETLTNGSSIDFGTLEFSIEKYVKKNKSQTTILETEKKKECKRRKTRRRERERQKMIILIG